MSKKGERVEERCLRLVLIEHTKNYLQLLEISENQLWKLKDYIFCEWKYLKHSKDRNRILWKTHFIILTMHLKRNKTLKSKIALHQDIKKKPLLLQET